MLSNCGARENSWEPLGKQRSNQSILKQINPGYSLKGLMLKLKLQKTRWLDSISDSMDVSFSKLWVMVMDREAWRAAVHEVAKTQTWLSDWTENTVKAEEKQRWNLSKPQATSPRKVLSQNFSHVQNRLSNVYHLSHQIIRDFSKLQKPKIVTCHWLARPRAVV